MTDREKVIFLYGRLIIVEHFVSKYTGFECDLYSPESLAALGKEDLACPDSPNWVNQSVLVQQFGWTRTMISKFLPAPKLEANPRYRSAPDMKLWRIEDIEAAMARDDFQEAAEKAKASRAAGRKGAETRRQKLAAEVDEKSRTSALSPWTKIASEKPPLQPNQLLLHRPREISTKNPQSDWTGGFLLAKKALLERVIDDRKGAGDNQVRGPGYGGYQTGTPVREIRKR